LLINQSRRTHIKTTTAITGDLERRAHGGPLGGEGQHRRGGGGVVHLDLVGRGRPVLHPVARRHRQADALVLLEVLGGELLRVAAGGRAVARPADGERHRVAVGVRGRLDDDELERLAALGVARLDHHARRDGRRVHHLHRRGRGRTVHLAVARDHAHLEAIAAGHRAAGDLAPPVLRAGEDREQGLQALQEFLADERLAEPRPDPALPETTQLDGAAAPTGPAQPAAAPAQGSLEGVAHAFAALATDLAAQDRQAAQRLSSVRDAVVESEGRFRRLPGLAGAVQTLSQTNRTDADTLRRRAGNVGGAQRAVSGEPQQSQRLPVLQQRLDAARRAFSDAQGEVAPRFRKGVAVSVAAMEVAAAEASASAWETLAGLQAQIATGARTAAAGPGAVSPSVRVAAEAAVRVLEELDQWSGLLLERLSTVLAGPAQAAPGADLVRQAQARAALRAHAVRDALDEARHQLARVTPGVTGAEQATAAIAATGYAAELLGGQAERAAGRDLALRQLDRAGGLLLDARPDPAADNSTLAQRRRDMLPRLGSALSPAQAALAAARSVAVASVATFMDLARQTQHAASARPFEPASAELAGLRERLGAAVVQVRHDLQVMGAAARTVHRDATQVLAELEAQLDTARTDHALTTTGQPVPDYTPQQANVVATAQSVADLAKLEARQSRRLVARVDRTAMALQAAVPAGPAQAAVSSIFKIYLISIICI